MCVLPFPCLVSMPIGNFMYRSCSIRSWVQAKIKSTWCVFHSLMTEIIGMIPIETKLLLTSRYWCSFFQINCFNMNVQSYFPLLYYYCIDISIGIFIPEGIHYQLSFRILLPEDELPIFPFSVIFDFLEYGPYEFFLIGILHCLMKAYCILICFVQTFNRIFHIIFSLLVFFLH